MTTFTAGQKVRVKDTFGSTYPEYSDGSMEAMRGREGVVVGHLRAYIDVEVRDRDDELVKFPFALDEIEAV